MTPILSVVLGLLVLGILVFIHEMGHFIAAKSCGIRVVAFSLGFGKPLLVRIVGGTEYRISAIPFGGYVKMAGEHPEDEHMGAPDEFQSKPVWQRMIVAISGPLFNYIAAFLMLFIMYSAGIERPLYMERPVIGAVKEGSIAQSVGLFSGDSIIAINQKSVTDWESIENAFITNERIYTIQYMRNGVLSHAVIEGKKESGTSLSSDITHGLLPPLPALVAEVLPESAAEKAGMKKGDVVQSISGKKINSWHEMVYFLEKYRGDTILSFNVVRGKNPIVLSVMPHYDTTLKRSLIGVRVSEGSGRIVRYPPLAAVEKALDKSVEYTAMIFNVIGKLFSREVSANQLSGPLGIIPASGFMALQGLVPILNFMALIGINLAILNLLPLVITDGGLIFFMLIEIIRRKPLSLRKQLIFNKVAIAIFLALFLFVSLNDVKRLPDYFRIFGK